MHWKLQEDHMTTNDYYWIVRNNCVPRLKALNQGYTGQYNLNEITWTQDGAPPHRANRVIQYLEGQFQNRIFALGTNLGHEWAPRSPEMNPWDYGFFGEIERQVFVPPQPTTLPQLRARITAVIGSLTPAYIRKTCDALRRRCQACVQANGGPFEHLL